MATDTVPTNPPTDTLKRPAEIAGLDDPGRQGQNEISKESVDGRTWVIQQLSLMERSLQEACFYRALIARFQIDLRQRNLTHLQPRPPAHLLKQFNKACIQWEACRMRVEAYVRQSAVVYAENVARAALPPAEAVQASKSPSPSPTIPKAIETATQQDVIGDVEKLPSDVIDLSGSLDNTNASGPERLDGAVLIDLEKPTTVNKPMTAPAESFTTAQVEANQPGLTDKSNDVSILQQMLAAASASNSHPITTDQPDSTGNFASPFDPTQFMSSLDNSMLTFDESGNPTGGGGNISDLAALDSLSDADLAAWSAAAGMGMGMGDGMFGVDGADSGDLGGIDMSQFAEMMKGLPGGDQTGGQGLQPTAGKNGDQAQAGPSQSSGDAGVTADPSSFIPLDGGDWNGMDLDSMLDSFFQPEQGEGGGS